MLEQATNVNIHMHPNQYDYIYSKFFLESPN